MHLLERAPHTDTHTKLVSQSWWLHVWYSKLHLFTKHGYYTCTHTCTRAFVSSSRSKLWQSAGVWPLFYISRTLCCVQHSSWHITRLSYPSPCSAIHLAYWGSVALRKCCFDMKTPGARFFEVRRMKIFCSWLLTQHTSTVHFSLIFLLVKLKFIPSELSVYNNRWMLGWTLVFWIHWTHKVKLSENDQWRLTADSMTLYLLHIYMSIQVIGIYTL